MPGSSKWCSIPVSRANASHNSFPHACYIPHISSFIWFLKQYIVKSRDYEHAYNIVVFISLLPFPFSPRYHSQHTNHKHSQPMFLLVRNQVLRPYKRTCKDIVLCILIFTFLGRNLQSTWFWTKWQQAFPKCTLLLLISFWMQFRYVRVIHKYLNFFHTFTGFVTCVYVLWFCAACCWWNRNIFSAFSTFTSRPVSLQWTDEAYGVYGLTP